MKSKKINKLTLTVAAALVSSLIASCGGHHSKSDTPEEGILVQYGDLISGKPYEVSSPGASDITSDIGTVSKINPVTGEKGKDGIWFFTIPEDFYTSYKVTYEELAGIPVTFSVTNSKGEIKDYKIELSGGDSFLQDQWHLYNIGQNPFGVDISPTPRVDLNVVPAWRKVITTDAGKIQVDGSGVKIAVMDTLVDFMNPDLKDRKYTPEDADSEFMNVEFQEDWLKNINMLFHGTAVAGIIGSTGMNSAGVRGIAFNSMITGFTIGDAKNYGDDELFGFNTIERSESYVAGHPEYNIINASFGDVEFSSSASEHSYIDAFYENNTALIHSMGNSYEDDEMDDYVENHNLPEEYETKLSTCSNYSTDCTFMLTDTMSRHPYVINTAAVTASGKKSTYSSATAGLWISGFGGEYGYLKPSPITPVTEAAIVTTFTGMNNVPPDKYHDTGSPWLESGPEEKKYYTATMNGTSAASPTVSGVVALAYQVKPDMTIGQLRYMLAKTGRNDNVFDSMKYGPVTATDSAGEQVITDPGWIDNAAGLRFSNFYGFGLVDAAALVNFAEKCNEDSACRQLKDSPNHYVSTNSNPCEQTTEGSIVCTLSDFRQTDTEDDTEKELDGTAVIDALTVDVQGLIYATEQTIEACSGLETLPQSNSVDNSSVQEYRGKVILANTNVQMTISSPSGTTGVVKPLYSVWDLNYDIDDTLYSSEPEREAKLPVSLFYREELKPGDTVTFTIKSQCAVDIEQLNKFMKADVYTYPKL